MGLFKKMIGVKTDKPKNIEIIGGGSDGCVYTNYCYYHAGRMAQLSDGTWVVRECC